MAEAEADRGSPFWRFSLGFYRQPGVADACIALQDGCGVDVNILLFLLWLAAAKRQVSPATARAVCAQAGPWRDDVVAPLRALRRKIKEGSWFIERNTAELFRTKIKVVEIESERLQQEALFALAAGLATDDAPTIDAAARANVAAYEGVMARTFTANAVETLVAVLGKSPAATGTR